MAVVGPMGDAKTNTIMRYRGHVWFDGQGLLRNQAEDAAMENATVANGSACRFCVSGMLAWFGPEYMLFTETSYPRGIRCKGKEKVEQ